MKAQFVYETLDFERTKSPKDSIGLGIYPGKKIDFAYWVSRGYGSILPDYMRMVKATIEEVNGLSFTVMYKNEYGRIVSEETSISDIKKRMNEYQKQLDKDRKGWGRN